MGSANVARITSRLKAFDQQKRRETLSDSNTQPDLLGYSLGTSMAEVAPKVILKKHAGAVHSHSKLSCLERKLMNVCIMLAYDELLDPSKQFHRAPIGTISTHVGFDTSKNTAHLKKAFRSLVTAIVEWSIVDERGAETWEARSVLSGVRFRNGMCEFEFPWFLREKFYEPERYARLNLEEMRPLSSVAAVALYEILVRYKNLRSTRAFSIEEWRAQLSADAATYDDFRRLNEKVIRPAVAQINQHTHLTTEPEFIREGRRVVAMRFHILDKIAPAIEQHVDEALKNDENEQAAVPSPLAQRLYDEMLLSRSQVQDVLREHDEARILSVLDYVSKRHLEGKITSSLPAYFLSTIARFEETARESSLDKRRREAENAKRSQEDSAKRQQSYREAFSAVWRARARQVLDEMTDEQRAIVFAEFETHLQATDNPALSQWQGPERETSAALAALLRNFVAERYLPDREAAFAEWAKAQEAAAA